MRQHWAWLSGDKRINGWAILILGVSLAVLVVGVHFAHGFQVRRNAHGLVEKATQVEEAGQPQEAAQHLQRYLGLRPDDIDALERYGLLLNRLAQTGKAQIQAFFVLEQVIRRDSQRRKVRLEVAKLATRLGRFADAKEHLDRLKQDKDESPELLHLYARSQAGLGDYDAAAKSYKQAIEKSPGETAISLEYAGLLRRQFRLDDVADDLIEKMVIADRRSLSVRLDAVRYFRLSGQLEPAWKHLRYALDELHADSADWLHLAGDVALARGETELARGFFEQGRKAFPKDARMKQGLADVALRQGERKKAQEYLADSLRDVSQQPEDLWELANRLVNAGSVEQARGVLKQLSKSAPPSLTQLLEARLLIHDGRWGPASKILEQIQRDRNISPGLTRYVPLLLAQSYEKLDNPDQRLESFRRAVEADPASAVARRGLANALAVVGKTDLAIAEYRKVLPQAPEAWPELGRLLVVRVLRQPSAQRDWSEVDRFVATPPGSPRRCRAPCADRSAHCPGQARRGAQARPGGAR